MRVKGRRLKAPIVFKEVGVAGVTEKHRDAVKGEAGKAQITPCT